MFPGAQFSRRIPTCDPHIGQGSGPARGKDGHTGPLPSYLWDGVEVSTVCSQGSGSIELSFQFSWPFEVFFSFLYFFFFCDSRQNLFTELEASWRGGVMNALDTSICSFKRIIFKIMLY